MNEYEYIAKRVTEGELLCQIAEESAELAQAALKYKRSMGNGNPTPVQTAAALRHLLEEIADVRLAVDVWKVRYNDGTDEADGIIDEIEDEKRSRWIRRLNGKE